MSAVSLIREKLPSRTPAKGRSNGLGTVADVPAGMVATKIPAGKFAVFTSEKGAAQKVVPELWMKINSLPKTAVGGDRVYHADYKVYDERAKDPGNLQVEVYVGIK